MRILLYHEIVAGEPTDIHAVRLADLECQVRWLLDAGYDCVALDRSVTHDGPRRPGKAVAITFDDGYEDFFSLALPVLRAEGFFATVFLVAGLVGAPAPWHPARPPLLSWSQVHDAADAGTQFGSHGLTHRDLTRLPSRALESELCDSRGLLQSQLGGPVRFFAYPYSQHNASVRHAVEACGYEVACTYQPHYAGGPGSRPYELQRIGILATDTLNDFAAKVRASPSRRAAWLKSLLRSRVRRALSPLARLS